MTLDYLKHFKYAVLNYIHHIHILIRKSGGGDVVVTFEISLYSHI